jgi:hypothetical protein
VWQLGRARARALFICTCGIQEILHRLLIKNFRCPFAPVEFDPQRQFVKHISAY